MKRLAIAVLAACDGSSPAQIDAAIDGAATLDGQFDGPSAFTLTSPMLAPGASFVAANTCDGALNMSPQLVWSGNAIGAASFAVVLTDKSNNLVHWVIYDVPASATGLPENVEKVYAPSNVAGAHQTASYQATVRGYLGPCPPSGPAHTYEFAVYGLDVATLPGASMATTRADAVTLITQHDTAQATLTGMYMR